MSGEDSGGLFEDLSEEDQMLTLLAGRIRFAIENTPGTRVGKDEVALVIITETHGPSFAKRVLKLPELRKKLGLAEQHPTRASLPRFT
jgi:hypothetical protein